MATMKKIPAPYLWGGAGLLIVLLGAGTVLFFINRSDTALEGRFQAVKGLFGRLTDSVADTFTSDDKPGGGGGGGGGGSGSGGVRTHLVSEGENLWAIARKGKLVDSPWQWKTIVDQNKGKIDYTFIAQDTGEWKVVLEQGLELEVRPEPFVPDTGPVPKKFALQLLSIPAENRKEAVKIVTTLLRGGHFAYFYRAKVEGRTMVRIRSGFYETKKQAEKAAEGIKEKYQRKNLLPDEILVVTPSDRELRGELLDFGIQRAKPWVIQLPRQDSHQKALQEFKQASETGDFAYIAQKRSSPTGVFSYHVRVGYFGTAKQAKSFLEENEDELKDGKVIRLTGFSETLPGQRMKMGRPRS